MLNELKTLKDIEVYITTEYDCGKDGRGNFVFQDIKKLMRAEAIKWIKRFNEKDFEYKADFPFGDGKLYNATFQDRAMIIGWIKHFFNITDEDLK